MSIIELSPISIVVIGLNEEKNLHNTFSAINNMNYLRDKIELIYVDSGSKDRSIEIAKQYADKVVIEKSTWPTAARGRNRGLIEAKNEIVHFIDGDIQIDKNYLKKAVAKIKEPNIHAVYGYLEEKSKNGINKILLSRWKYKKPGLSSAAGAGGTFKKCSLLKVNGYDERISRGEETELGERFRKAGFNIWMLDTKMGMHDYGVHSIFDYLKTQYVDGKSRMFNSFLKKSNNFFKNNNSKSASNILQNLIVIFIILMLLVSHKFLFILIFPFIYLAFLLVKYIGFKRIRDKKVILYFLMMNFSKPVVFIGQINVFISFCYNKIIKRKSFPSPKMELNKF